MGLGVLKGGRGVDKQVVGAGARGTGGGGRGRQTGSWGWC